MKLLMKMLGTDKMQFGVVALVSTVLMMATGLSGGQYSESGTETLSEVALSPVDLGLVNTLVGTAGISRADALGVLPTAWRICNDLMQLSAGSLPEVAVENYAYSTYETQDTFTYGEMLSVVEVVSDSYCPIHFH